MRSHRSLCIVSFVAVVVAGSSYLGHAEPNDYAITLRVAAPRVGQKWTDEKSQSFHVVITGNGKQTPMTGERVGTRKVEVLEVTAGAITKANYTYVKYSDVQKLGGKAKGGGSPIDGKSYTLTAGTPIDVSVGGKPAAEAEAAAVRELEKRFGKPDRLGKVLDGKTFTRGKVTDLPAADIADAMGDDPDLKLTKLALTYRGKVGKQAMFDIALVIEGDKKAGHTKMDLAGKAAVDPKTGELVDLDLVGTMKIIGTVAADGTMKMKARRIE
jgi:hypothetical protein